MAESDAATPHADPEPARRRLVEPPAMRVVTNGWFFTRERRATVEELRREDANDKRGKWPLLKAG